MNKSKFSLTAQQMDDFHTKGYTEPFNIINKDEIRDFKKTFNKILEDQKLLSPIYGRCTHRDWHLYYRNLMLMVYRPQVVERLKSLLGSDLMVWRTSIFHKAPGDGALGWHQSSLFAGEEYGIFKPALLPPVGYDTYGKLFNLSCWIALDDVTIENGAMQVAEGTHNKQYPIKKVPFKDSVFGKVAYDSFKRIGDIARLEELDSRYACETIFNPREEKIKVNTITMKAGQGYIFTDRLMHNSLANVTVDSRRLAINFRITIPETLVYPHRLDGDLIDGNDHNIKNHGCVMLNGKSMGVNNIFYN
ncbi:phytanoyl-CoA dioxygenase family protein [Aliivibrio sp. S4TY2]|uniref:phytanoyl-CoA dioxygenase family protein n=2 Tax=Aliivibrio TaxID=511678 RepID=UPI0023784786|nr:MULTISPECIES: phytanoyl-CoA dioxygenase family protein [unclassified Aliivibrio]MDD9156570.1 phytanoyl-CoA dioxygenase family protein [Aliivibrio sp. S4TY2]MDD9159993.1 phytanoyl-CoA dioxygenase family protein [Aliivibrio sp. S4TY1]MDD9164215.1 phytanoyl-CoA dioxygenase family protein [Aliivibrio sp. S4MY2]MDD9168277.1 phytanoyl-CoA dioxygenase family protein [Aliivibrio sp. S4MY4]MDD9184613.1 phytanoyl-CoA dioxygenase family protein [Aliivibrio sp. S4MY3]